MPYETWGARYLDPCCMAHFLHTQSRSITGRANEIFCAVAFAKFISKIKGNF